MDNSDYHFANESYLHFVAPITERGKPALRRMRGRMDPAAERPEDQIGQVPNKAERRIETRGGPQGSPIFWPTA
jgi:hypothetical protein